MNRRGFLWASAAAAAFNAVPGIATAEASSDIMVEITTGKLSGLREEGVSAFLGIPYGEPTRRFLPPKPAKAWPGTRAATAFGHRAPQLDPAADPTVQKFMGKMVRFSHDPTSEDCLVLNVWTPATDAAKRPVMFWCHGGGFALGSGQEPDYIGANLARKHDVVVVTVNHRLNVLGYCYVGHLGGAEFAQSGNVGMLDLVLALNWVRDNIARFGGDPDNVTLFGQSGGGVKVSVLLAMPAPKGLFHKAIIMSGPGTRVTELGKAEQKTNELLTRLDLGKDGFQTLRTMPVEKLVQVGGAIGAMGPGVISFDPVLDQISILSHPFDPKATDVSASVPLIIGHTRDEMSLMMVREILANTMTEAEFAARVKFIVGSEHADEAAALYHQTYPNISRAQLFADIATDSYMGYGSTRIAELKVEQGRAPVYCYLTTWEAPAALGGVLRAAHGEDTGLAFDNVDIGREGQYGPGPAPQQIADILSGGFTQFARSANPSHAGIPAWPQYTLARRETLIVDVPPRVEKDPQKSLREFWSRVGVKIPA
jgi:para-nitrobenzyl esterase